MSLYCAGAKYDEYKRLKHGTGKEGDDGEGGEEERHRIEREEHENLRSERRRLFAESLKSLTRKQALRVQSKLHNYPPELREAAAEALDERLARNDGEANNAKGPEAPPTKAARPRDGSSTDDGEEMEKELRNDGDDGALDGPGAYGEGEKLPFGALGLGLSEDDDGVANP